MSSAMGSLSSVSYFFQLHHAKARSFRNPTRNYSLSCLPGKREHQHPWEPAAVYFPSSIMHLGSFRHCSSVPVLNNGSNTLKAPPFHQTSPREACLQEFGTLLASPPCTPGLGLCAVTWRCLPHASSAHGVSVLIVPTKAAEQTS